MVIRLYILFHLCSVESNQIMLNTKLPEEKFQKPKFNAIYTCSNKWKAAEIENLIYLIHIILDFSKYCYQICFIICYELRIVLPISNVLFKTYLFSIFQSQMINRKYCSLCSSLYIRFTKILIKIRWKWNPGENKSWLDIFCQQ